MRYQLLWAMLCTFVATATQANPPHGVWSFTPHLGGMALGCQNVSGKPVAMMVDNQLNDVARAYPDDRLIKLNGRAMIKVPPLVAQFWYLHECAHHALPQPVNASESAADCWAIKTARRLGLITTEFQLKQLVKTMLPFAGDSAHLPGPLRAKLVKSCWKKPKGKNANLWTWMPPVKQSTVLARSSYSRLLPLPQGRRSVSGISK